MHAVVDTRRRRRQRRGRGLNSAIHPSTAEHGHPPLLLFTDACGDRDIERKREQKNATTDAVESQLSALFTTAPPIRVWVGRRHCCSRATTTLGLRTTIARIYDSTPPTQGPHRTARANTTNCAENSQTTKIHPGWSRNRFFNICFA